MIRDWDTIKVILERIEKGDFQSYVDREGYLTDDHIDESDFFGHIEILSDAGIIKRCTINRNVKGKIVLCDFSGVFISMQGHDLLDALRDKNVWNEIKSKAITSGVSLSWEFIKAAIPVVIREILNR